MDYKYQVRLVASSISKVGMPYTKHYSLCSVRYSLAQPLFSFNCPVNCSEWLWRVGCTLVYRPWPTSWLINLGGEILLSRDCVTSTRLTVCLSVSLSLLASVCVCLNIVCAGLSSIDLLFFKVWE